ncbi:iron (Fe3+) ABC transporter binding protein [Staphylococcus simiae CCM 7213 = CCUG 51256]|uniref:Iron (Fe3+) ABC transporter binding protein n=1 Tax=Staphylococcus simiae CCM 7213 = CCUG 51256 TaxID=911238 RepID=G5JHT4_9STAP|nr:ABC transporter substrate-binding protein [Staphylococcus simiae]EHJ08251.1 iron (Fe3+) ABC transporter binding protein [Staphylococcus simiae CCM 7213 = CCUG 51256]SNV62851.1 Periplasmic binding protein [Staphylococcus simiae]
MKTRLLALVIVILLIATACSNGKNDKVNSNKEQDNKTPYHRIISLMPSNTEILYKLGLEDNIVGVSTVDDYPKDVKKGKKQFDALNLNKEALLKEKPDLILAHESQKGTTDKVLKSIEKSGVKVAYVKDAQSIDETYDTFKQIGKITHRQQQADQLVDDTKKSVNKVINSIPKHHKQPNVFIEISSKPDIYTAGKHTFFNDMLTKLDAKNSFDDIDGWKSVSKESIIKHNPDILISTEAKTRADYMDMIKQRGGFKNIKAVKNTRIEIVNSDEVSRPGPRIADGLKDLRDAIYRK